MFSGKQFSSISEYRGHKLNLNQGHHTLEFDSTAAYKTHVTQYLTPLMSKSRVSPLERVDLNVKTKRQISNTKKPCRHKNIS